LRTNVDDFMAEGPRTPRLARRGLTALAVALSAFAGLSALAPTTASAAGEGMEELCSQAGYGCVGETGYRGQSVWGANYGRTGHNCTSYVSWMLAQAGAAQPWFTMGNASAWDDRGQGKVPVDDNPTVGSVAQWDGGTRLAPGAGGHVAMVDVVGPGWIEVTDDTGAGVTRRLRIHEGSPYWPSSFVHIHDRLVVRDLVAAVWAGVLVPQAHPVGWLAASVVDVI
jgi:surface antigen